MKYSDDLKLLEEAALKAAPIVMKYFKTDLVVEKKIDAGNSPVTIADKETDEFLQKFLINARPNYGWLSEEIEDDESRLSKKHVFIVDPIDGTKPFIKGLPEFVISIAIVEDGKPVVGVVYNPATKEMYAAAKGLGVKYNGKKVQPCHVNKPLKSQTCLISISEEKKGLWKPFAGKFLTKPMGSIAYKLAMVAANQFDFMVTLRPKSEWDTAAGQLLCLEAGLKVTDILGKQISYNTQTPESAINRMIVSSPNVYNELQLLFKDC